MGKTLSFLVILAGLLLSAEPLESQEFPLTGGNAYQAFLRTIYDRLERFAALSLPSKMTFLADGSDGGGDGSGSGTGGTGDGGNGGTDGTGEDGGTDGGTDGTDGGDSDSASNGAADAAAATSDAAPATSDDAATAAAASTSDDAAAAAAASTSDDAAAAAAAPTSDTAAASAVTTTTTDAAAVAATTTTTTDNADPNAPTTDPTAVTVAPTTPTDPTTEQNAVTPELSAIEDVATTNPRGGSGPSDIAGPGVAEPGPGGAIAPGAPAAPVDVAINAVIVSAAQSPWDAIRKAPGVRNVIVTGGIIALGKTAIAGEIPGGGPQPAWLRLIPDLRLLNGSIVPPVVPNVIDIRIMNCPIKIENPAE